MDLKAKVITILLGVFFFYGVLDYSIQRFIVFPKFEELERKEANDDIQRTVHAFQREMETLDSLCHDWASWDDVYQFIEHPTQAFIESNLAFSTFKDNKINLIYACNLQGKVIWGKIYDLGTNKAIDLTDFPQDMMPPEHPLLQLNLHRASLADVSLTGVIVTERGPLFVASRPILRSGNIGPLRGSLIMGKFLNNELAKKLVEQTRVNFSIITNVQAAKDILRKASPAFGKEFPSAIEKADENRLQIMTVYPDIRGKPAFLIRSTFHRDIINGGKQAMRYALGMLAVVGMVVVIVVLLLMERTILHPVTNLTRHVLSVSETGNFSLRLAVKRRDEIGTLAREFDRMLEKIDDMNMVMESINDQLMEDITKRQEMETKLQEANRQLEKLATLDGLTQLSNRRRFDEYLDVEWKRGMRDNTPLSLIILDVDFFKLFNDTYGHQAGDDCLRSIANAINAHVKRVSDFAARYGGEEFAVILPGTDIDGATHIAEAIRMHLYSLAMPHDKSNLDHRVTISAGISCIVPEKGESAEMLIRLADKALYEAKAKGRNRSVSLSEL